MSIESHLGIFQTLKKLIFQQKLTIEESFFQKRTWKDYLNLEKH